MEKTMTPDDEITAVAAYVLLKLSSQYTDSLEQAADLRAKLEEMRKRLGVEL
jgi:hypothetical protein